MRETVRRHGLCGAVEGRLYSHSSRSCTRALTRAAGLTLELSHDAEMAHDTPMHPSKQLQVALPLLEACFHCWPFAQALIVEL